MNSLRTNRPLTLFRFGGRSAAAPAILIVAILSQSPISSQEVSPLRLKAFLIWNIAKYTRWPAGAFGPGHPFTVCVIGNAVVADALKDTAKDRRLTDRPVAVIQSAGSEQPPDGCDVLFISGVPSKQISQLVSVVRDRPVLTISDTDGSAGAGVMVQFLYEGSQLGYRVQLEPARRARLEINALVLRMAR